MQNFDKTYRQHLYGSEQKKTIAQHIVYAEAKDKMIYIHYVDLFGKLQSLMTADTSLMQIMAFHPKSFVAVSRNTLVRADYVLEYTDTGYKLPKSVRIQHVDHPINVSRRSFGLIKAAVAKESHGQA